MTETYELTPEIKQRIDSMSQYEMCSLWRFAKSGNRLLSGETGDYFTKVMKEKGGFTPEISNSLGY